MCARIPNKSEGRRAHTPIEHEHAETDTQRMVGWGNRRLYDCVPLLQLCSQVRRRHVDDPKPALAVLLNQLFHRQRLEPFPHQKLRVCRQDQIERCGFYDQGIGTLRLHRLRLGPFPHQKLEGHAERKDKRVADVSDGVDVNGRSVFDSVSNPSRISSCGYADRGNQRCGGQKAREWM